MAAQSPVRRSAPADAARLAAAFFVVLIHSSGIEGAGILWNALSRFGVPVFVILSGYFTLDRPRGARELLRRSARLLAIMLCWSVIYYAWLLASGTREWEGARVMLRYFVTEPVHMWYIYTTVFLYALTPLLGVFCGHASRRQYEYALLLCFGLGGVYELLHAYALSPTLMLIAENAHILRGAGFLFFFLLGGYFRRYELSRRAALALYILAALGLACTMAGAAATSRGGLDERFLSYTTPFVMLTAAGFTLFCLRRRLPPSARLSAAARCTLGVYLLHPMLILIPQHLGIWEPAVLPLWLAVPLRALGVYAVTLAISLLLSRVPAVGRLVA